MLEKIKNFLWYASARVVPDCFYTAHIIQKKCPHWNSSNFFFIQIGAYDGKSFDPIYHYVKKYKWKGILVEPIEEYFKKLQTTYAGIPNLSFEHAAISDMDGMHTMYRFIAPQGARVSRWIAGTASLHKEIFLKSAKKLYSNAKENVVEEQVQCMTLSRLLSQHRVQHVDLLCIDAEGSEYEILMQLKTLQELPRAIFYEHKHLTSEKRADLVNLLTKLGYRIQTDYRDTFVYKYINI